MSAESRGLAEAAPKDTLLSEDECVYSLTSDATQNRIWMNVYVRHKLGTDAERHALAAYIAAANPTAILALLDALDAARAERDALRSMLIEARRALAGGLWDYGPGQDEHEQCNEVLARIDALLEGR